MKGRIRNVLHEAGLLIPVRELFERGRVLRRLLRPAPPVPLHRNEPVDPFFIVGSGRCGTTLLRRILQASPAIHIPPENWALGPCIHLFSKYRRLMSWRDMVHLLLGRHVFGSSRWFNEPPFDLRQRLLEIPAGERSLARLLDEVYRYHGDLQGAAFERWGDKTPLNVDSMDEIAAVFPRARFIHLLRDGVDVVYSWSKRRKYFGDLARPASRWTTAVAKARAFGTSCPERFLEVRYEELVEQPETTVQRICQFIGLAYDPGLLEQREHYDEMRKAQSISHYENVFKSISTESIGKGRRNLNTKQKNQLAALIGERLVHLGYELP